LFLSIPNWDARLSITVFSSLAVSSQFPPQSCFLWVGMLSIGKERGGFGGGGTGIGFLLGTSFGF